MKIIELFSKVETPIGVIGLTIGVLYLLYRLLLRGHLLSKLGPTSSFRIINRVVNYVFILVLLAIVLGFSSHLLSNFSENSANSQSSPQSDSLMTIDQPITFAEISHERSFRLLNFDDLELCRSIEKATNFKYDPSSKALFTIEFAHTGSYYPSQIEGYAHFTGGYIIVKINGVTCHEFKELKLKENLGGIGNPRYIIEKDIKEDFFEMIKGKRDLISQKISDCLQNAK